jgi:hypothetical protein
MFGPYLRRLIKWERNPVWLHDVLLSAPIIWVAACGLIWFRIGAPVSYYPSFGLVFYLLLGVVLIAGCLVFTVFTAAQLTFREGQVEQLELLSLTNISMVTIFWSLVLGTIYRVRFWFLGIFGFCPYLLWLSCRSYFVLCNHNYNDCTTLLGHQYFSFGYAGGFMRQLELAWLVSLTLSILGLSVLSMLCCIGLTIKSKSATLSAIGVLIVALPIIFVLVLVLAPEGFLVVGTAYEAEQVTAAFDQTCPVGIAVMAVPLVASRVAQRLLQRWVFK